MKIPLADFYLLCIAYLASRMADEPGDIFDYLTIAVESERTRDLDSLPAERREAMVEFRTDGMMFAAVPPLSINNRVFTWEEYSALQQSGQFVFIPDDYIETDPPVEDEIARYAATLRRFIEPMLQGSFEMITRESEF